MANRSVFVASDKAPFFKEVIVEFDYFQGFALSQKRKNQIGIHQNFMIFYPNEKPLEISSSSIYRSGFDLSAMNLTKQTKGGLTSVESAFQSSKVFRENSGEILSFADCLYLSGRECKRKVKEQSQGCELLHFDFEGVVFPKDTDYHPSLFYDYIYLNALLEPENADAAKALYEKGYTAFTDLATLSINSQAKSCAIFVGLVKSGRINEVKNSESFLKLFDRTEIIKNYSAPYKTRCKFHKEDASNYYDTHFANLTNKKDDNNFIID